MRSDRLHVFSALVGGGEGPEVASWVRVGRGGGRGEVAQPACLPPLQQQPGAPSSEECVLMFVSTTRNEFAFIIYCRKKLSLKVFPAVCIKRIE